MLTQLAGVSLLVISVTASPLSTSHIIDRSNANQRLTLAPVHRSTIPENHVQDSYIVVLKDGVDLTTHSAVLSGARADDPFAGDERGLIHVYDGQIKGYAGRFANTTIAKLRSMAEVDYIEHDQVVYASEIEKGAPWGLARISHRKKLGFGTFREYIYDKHGGEGVDAYVIDTGVNIHHVEFEGRAKWGKTIPQNDVDEDANGHGTHCAGTIGSRKYGVAKSANIVAVKVLGSNGSGTMSDVLAGVVWAAGQAAQKMQEARAEYAATGKTSHKGSVANMSLGGGFSKALNDAVNKAVDAGLHFAVAAGNEDKDACGTSPAAAEKAITVGASTIADQRAYFSNHGKCVDVFAPGLNILSTWTGSSTATNTISGTSMASPHVAGLLAYLLSIYPSATFDPGMKASLIPESAKQPLNGFTAAATSSFYTAVHASLPSWASRFLPSPQSILSRDELAPIPSILTPAQLKRALIDLSTPDLLTDLPANTINKLVFNNATELKFGLF